MLIKGSPMLFRDKHRCLFLFCLVVCYPRGPVNHPTWSYCPRWLIFSKRPRCKRAVGLILEADSNFQYLVIRCFLCIGYFTLTAGVCQPHHLNKSTRCYADNSTLKGLLTIFVSIAQISYFSNGVWYSWFWSDAICPKLKHFRFQFCPQGFWLATLN